MFETDEFKAQLTRAISVQAAVRRFKFYDPKVVEFLQKTAKDNEPPLMESEMKKVASARRGIPSALESAARLVEEAARIASTDPKAETLTEAHIKAAHVNLFCSVWPFCRGV